MSVTTGPVQLRRARPADVPGLAAVFDSAVLAGWTYFEDIASLVPMFEPQHWEDLVGELAPPNTLLVAERDDQVVGFVATKAREGELFLLFVHADHGGAGIGRRLLAAAHDALREQGHNSVYLFTHEANTRARQVYEAAGYRHDGGYRTDLGRAPARGIRAAGPGFAVPYRSRGWAVLPSTRTSPCPPRPGRVAPESGGGRARVALAPSRSDAVGALAATVET